MRDSCSAHIPSVAAQFHTYTGQLRIQSLMWSGPAAFSSLTISSFMLYNCCHLP